MTVPDLELVVEVPALDGPAVQFTAYHELFRSKVQGTGQASARACPPAPVPVPARRPAPYA